MSLIKKSIYLCLTFCFLLAPAYGADFSSGSRGISEANRADKNYSLTYMVLGFGPSRSVGAGGTFGIHLTPNTKIDFEFTAGRAVVLSLFGSNYDISTTSKGVHLKTFMGNSFYVRIGADYRDVKYKYTSPSWSSNTTEKFEGDSITVTGLIGNQWQWDNFTLGCDWIGYALPVTSKVKSESVEGATSYRDVFKDDQDFFLKQPAAIALRFYLGASF